MIAPFGPRSERASYGKQASGLQHKPYIFKILLIEDEKADAVLIESKLRESGLRPYQLERASSLEEGLEVLADSTEINVVLLDLYLSDSGGLHTFAKVQRQFPHLPIIVMTGLMDSRMGIQAVEMGAQNFLEKNHLTPHLLDSSIRFAIARMKKFRRLDHALSTARIANWELDPTTQEMKWSSFIYDLLKIDEKENPIHTLHDFMSWVHPDDIQLLEDKLMGVIGTGISVEIDLRMIAVDHIPVFVCFQADVEINAFESTNVLVGMIQDMTARKRMEALKAEKEVADRSAKLRQDFLARTSHEIRTPLNPILLLTKLLLDSEVNDQQREYLEAIRAAGRTLLAVVNDILDLSKIEAGKIEFVEEPFSLHQVMCQIEDMMETSATEKGLKFLMTLDRGLPEMVLGDSVRLSQILLNLLSNAIKFTPEGQVSVTVKEEARGGDKVDVRFTVSDTGIGIPEDKLKSIFESFQQIRSDLVRRQGGTGLGLTIVKKLVSLQGGEVEVESRPNEGSSFTFTLPFGLTARSQSLAPTEISKSELVGVRILMAEDDPLNQLVAKKLLSDWGVVLEIANHGEEAIEKMQQREFDLILMDVQMPIMDGLEATRRIRQKFSAPQSEIPIIALTANAFTGTDDECLQAGMNDYVSKPIEIANLYNKIVRYSRHRSLDEVPTDLLSPSHAPVALSTAPIDFDMAKITKIDLSYLQEVSNGDTDIVRMAIDKYLETTPGLVENLQIQLRALDYVQLSKAAHKLKSSLYFMGLNDLHQLALRVETSCKTEQNMDQLPIWVSEIAHGVAESYPQLTEAKGSL